MLKLKISCTVYLTCKFDANYPIRTDRHVVLAAGTLDDAAVPAADVDVVEDGQDVALVKVAALDDLVHDSSGAQFRHGQRFRIGTHLLSRNAADLVPSLAFTTGATLFESFEYLIKFPFS